MLFFVAVLSAHASGGTVSSFAVIPFKHVHIANGINDLTSVSREGKFICEKSGLYLISVFVSTFKNSNGYFIVYKNNDTIMTAFRHPQSYVLTATAIAIEQLEISDTVYVLNGPEMHVYSGTYSVFTINQIQ